jgi:hypothetical protein
MFLKSLILLIVPASSKTKHIRLVDAISEGLDEAMKKNDSLVIMGRILPNMEVFLKLRRVLLKNMEKIELEILLYVNLL